MAAAYGDGMPADHTDTLNPTALTRLRQALQPDWVQLCGLVAWPLLGLVVLAAVAAVRSNPDGDRLDTVVATRDLTPGVALSAEDVKVEKRLAATLPDGSQAELGSVVGATLASPVRRARS